MPVSFVDPGVSKEDTIILEATTEVITNNKKARLRPITKKILPTKKKVTTSHPRSNPEAELFIDLVDQVRQAINEAEQTAKDQKIDNAEGIRSLTRKAIRKGLVGHKWL